MYTYIVHISKINTLYSAGQDVGVPAGFYSGQRLCGDKTEDAVIIFHSKISDISVKRQTFTITANKICPHYAKVS